MSRILSISTLVWVCALVGCGAVKTKVTKEPWVCWDGSGGVINPRPGDGTVIAFGDREGGGKCIWFGADENGEYFKNSTGDFGELGIEISSFAIGPNTFLSADHIENGDGADRQNWGPQDHEIQVNVSNKLDGRIKKLYIQRRRP